MKVIIAVAGQGTRMLPLTKKKSKHLILIKGRPFLAYLLDRIFRAGFKELILVAGFRADLIEDFVKRYKPPKGEPRSKKLSGPPQKLKNYKIIVVNQHKILGAKEKKYGTVCPIICAKEFIGKENFLAVYGDSLFSEKDLKAMNINDKYSYAGAIYHKHPEKYGVLLTENDFLKEIVEKPEEYIGNLINTGLYKLTPEIFDKISKIKKSKRGEYELTDAINLLAEGKKVKVKKLKDYWLDFGSIEDIEKVSRFLNENRYKKSN